MKQVNNNLSIDRLKKCLDSIGNLHPDLYAKLLEDLENSPLISNLALLRSHVVKLLNLPSNGRNTINYWLARGWPKQQAYYNTKEHNKFKNHVSAYSREFWISKINLETGKHYTIEEADYERNSRRPVKKEYWMKKGYSENEAIEKAKKTSKNLSLKGHKNRKDPDLMRVNNKLCIEYWTLRGHSKEEAKKIISANQSTFSLDTCIKKHGEEKGKEIWLKRQEKWQNTLKQKSDAEIEDINKRKFAYNPDRFENITECVEKIVEVYGEKVILNEEEFLNKIKNDLEKSTYKKYWTPDKYVKTIPLYQFIVLDLTENQLINKISNLFVSGVFLLENSGAYKNYIKWVNGKLLRSSYEIYFYERITDINENYIISIDGMYPNSRLRYDFYMSNGDYIEICPICKNKIKTNKIIEYNNRIKKKIELFNPIILSTQEEIDSYIENYEHEFIRKCN
jgi:hypothetical protein